jgi:pimeloyl-ACP methyl ester carboxylesterase
MPYAQIEDGVRLYYELTGPDDGPVILQLGGGLFGRHNFGLVNDGFRERFRLLSFDARGYGASDHPREAYSIEGWATDAAGLLDAVGLDRVLVHGTSMGGMIAIAFTAAYPQRTIAACADVAFAKPDVYRRTVFRGWRRMVETMAWDDFSDHVTTQAVGARFMESPEGENIFQLVRDIVALNDPYTVRQACLAMENMDLSPLVRRISRPLLMTNGTHDILCPPDLAPSGLGARKMAELNEVIELVEFPDIGHADLVECPADATRIVGEFFERALDAALPSPPLTSADSSPPSR